MKQLTDHARAKAYLVHRERNYSTLYIMRGAISLYLLQLTVLIIFLAGSFTQSTGLFKNILYWGRRRDDGGICPGSWLVPQNESVMAPS